MTNIDLHIHTTKSDGSLTPFQIIDEAKKNNVKFISIADHDTIDAYSDNLFSYAEKNGISIIPAVEISTKISKCGIHILGYNIDLKNDNSKKKLEIARNSRHIYLHDVAKKLNSIGYLLDLEELDKIDSVTKAHIARNVIEKPENSKLLIKSFSHIPNQGEFIETIMNEGCIAYVKKITLSPAEAAKIIRDAGGKVVVAHPVAYFYEDDIDEKDIEKIVEDTNADGIEANYLYVDRNNILIDDIEKWNNFAKKHNLFVTIGSDFHKKDGIRPEIGFHNYNFSLASEKVIEIINNLQK